MSVDRAIATNYWPMTRPPGSALEADEKKLPLLFRPLPIRGITLHNRLLVSPMCMYSSTDGFWSDFHLAHYGHLALRGPGLIFTEATAVLENGRITPFCAGIYKDEHIPAMKRVVDFVHSQKVKIGIQLAHSGRKASCHFPGHPTKARESLDPTIGGWTDVWGPSEIPYDEYSIKPTEMTKEMIKTVQNGFVDAVKRSLVVGFDVIELHFAHGYLAHSFCCPITNTRKDEYGGSLENRIRFVIETVVEIRKILPKDYPLFVRISATDWYETGWGIKDSVILSRALSDNGVDLIDVSTSGNIARAHNTLKVGPSYQVPFAEEIRKDLIETGRWEKTKVGSVGLITDPKQANELLVEGKADVIFAGRQFLKDVGFVNTAAEALGVDTVHCRQYGWPFKKKCWFNETV